MSSIPPSIADPFGTLQCFQHCYRIATRFVYALDDGSFGAGRNYTSAVHDTVFWRKPHQRAGFIHGREYVHSAKNDHQRSATKSDGVDVPDIDDLNV